MVNVLFATVLLWGLEAFAVGPLARVFQRRMSAAASGGGVARAWICADVLVLLTAGFTAGLLGFWLVGVSRRARAWPGMLALCLSSVAAYSLGSAR